MRSTTGPIGKHDPRPRTDLYHHHRDLRPREFKILTVLKKPHLLRLPSRVANVKPAVYRSWSGACRQTDDCRLSAGAVEETAHSNSANPGFAAEVPRFVDTAAAEGLTLGLDVTQRFYCGHQHFMLPGETIGA